MAKRERTLKARGWASVSIAIEYIDYILEAAKREGQGGGISEFVRDAVREKLAYTSLRVPKYDTILERYELIAG